MEENTGLQQDYRNVCPHTHTPVVIVVINVSVLMFRALLSHTGSKHSKLSTQCVRGVQKGDVCGK